MASSLSIGVDQTLCALKHLLLTWNQQFVHIGNDGEHSFPLMQYQLLTCRFY